MNNLTPKERAEVVTLFIENERSIVETQRAYRKKYKGRKAPSDNTIRHLAANFFEHGSVANRGQHNRSRPRRSNAVIAAVRDSVVEDPTVSYRRRSQHLNVSGTTMRRVLNDLGMLPYKIQITQRLLAEDKPRRLSYARKVAEIVETVPHFWHEILMTDEAHSTLSGGVNKQNCRIWGTENPHAIHEEPLHDQKVTVWAGV